VRASDPHDALHVLGGSDPHNRGRGARRWVVRSVPAIAGHPITVENDGALAQVRGERLQFGLQQTHRQLLRNTK